MHAAVLGVLRTANRPISRRACRIVAGSRYPLAHRSFNRSAISYKAPEDPKAEEVGKDSAVPEAPESKAELDTEPDAEPEAGAEAENEGSDQSIFSPEAGNLVLFNKVRNGKPGSGRVRAGLRSKAPEGVPPIVIPSWFWEKNVKLVGELDLGGSLSVEGEKLFSSRTDSDNTAAETETVVESAEEPNLESTRIETTRYSIHKDIYKETLSSIRAGLILRPPKNSNSQALKRPITVLQCPKVGGTLFLDSVIESIAGKCEADLVRLDAQDIAQIVGPYTDEDPIWSSSKWQMSKTGTLGYKAHKFAGKMEEYDEDPKDEKDEDEEEEGFGSFSGQKANSIQLSGPMPSSRPISFKLQGGNGTLAQIPGGQDQWSDLKLSTAFDALITSGDAKRAASSIEMETLEEAEADSEPEEKRLIVQIKDYKELLGTQEGLDLVYRLRACVDKRWQEGRSIVLVGTTAIEDLDFPMLRSSVQHLQSDVVDGDSKTILVTPKRLEELDVVFESDEKARIRKINIRHVEDMILRLAEGVRDMSPNLDLEKDIDTAVAYAAGIEEAVWTYARVHRIATTILGLELESEDVDGVVFSQVLEILTSSDEAKFTWVAEENKTLEEDADLENMLKKEGTSEKKKAMEKISKLRRRCNMQEAKLLSGVVYPSDIRTTFADIRVPPETVEALKTLTSLSLTRPEAFRYGVLATDKIPGLLLYGPPGTGKTLLAKAVAKESGATVLEVTAADLNDMYVGNGEKNVRAVFSLAKKLSPCVVFIDEADAIFAARHEGMNRSAHREMINQFLREWDGLTTDISAFIMVATNRPFDLDEAVLRRLPRRILVDLPVEKDRETILKIHLADEILDESVSIEKLAKDTSFYSGSDLKNLAVAAALACIREENSLAAQHTGEEPFTYPEKRTLTSKHFEKAMEEISASISEDMSTLTAIRKFDEKYGDRKGRRKKGPGLGFGGTKTEEKDSEAVRVRKIGV
ncbi:AAA-domain-containing protein [Acephala macrosclerotiorum]|nr:AAA-domain-containing protein [Acephala macrosclerotiorum]